MRVEPRSGFSAGMGSCPTHQRAVHQIFPNTNPEGRTTAHRDSEVAIRCLVGLMRPEGPTVAQGVVDAGRGFGGAF